MFYKYKLTCKTVLLVISSEIGDSIFATFLLASLVSFFRRLSLNLATYKKYEHLEHMYKNKHTKGNRKSNGLPERFKNKTKFPAFHILKTVLLSN